MKKKIWIGAVTVVLIAALIAGSISIYQYRRRSRRVAEVYPVSMIAGGWYGSDTELYGFVEAGATQEIYLESGQQLQEILIAPGQEVTVGTPLLEYDSTQIQLDMERQELNLNSMTIQAQELQKQIRTLQNTRPGQSVALTVEDGSDPAGESSGSEDENSDSADESSGSADESSGSADESSGSVDENSDSTGESSDSADGSSDPADENSDPQGGDPGTQEQPVYSVIDRFDETVLGKYYDGEGSQKLPYTFLMGQEAVITKAHAQWFMGYDGATGEYDMDKALSVAYEKREGDTPEGKLEYGFLINGARWGFAPDAVAPDGQESEGADFGTQDSSAAQENTGTQGDSAAQENPDIQDAPGEGETGPVQPEEWYLTTLLEYQEEKETLQVKMVEQAFPGKMTVMINTAPYFTREPLYVYDGDLRLNSLTLDNGCTLFVIENGGTFEISPVLRDGSTPSEDEPIFEPEDPGWGDLPEIDGGVSYTKEELNSMIAERKSELAGLSIDMQLAELEYRQVEKKLDEMTVFSTIDGVVESVSDPETMLSQDPLIVVKSSEGFTLQGTLTEMQLGEIGVGAQIQVQSWMSGNMFSGTISEISDIPTENYYGWSSNQNLSYYPFTAFIEDGEGLTSGEQVQILVNGQEGPQSESIFLERGYVREENGERYVMKVGDNERLVKQPVKTGRIMYGSQIEILEGLTYEDRIAFPYGDGAYEGTRVKDVEY